MSSTAARSSSSIEMSARNEVHTVCSASRGHAVNQSIVQQLTSEGNLRSRVRKASPIGDMHSTTCRLARHCWTKRRHSPAGVMSLQPRSLARDVTPSRMVCTSSAAYRLGTSPMLRMLLMSSTIASSLICVSVKRKTVCVPASPACCSSRFTSSRHADMS